MDANKDDGKKIKKETKRRKTNHHPKTSPLVKQLTQQVNMVIRNEHPLLNPLILKTVLIYSTAHQDNRSFATLRLVCKLWDIEVCKILRPQTQIPLARLLSPYPEGLGWKWNRSHKSIGYQYQSPYPETPEFPNIKITVTTCKVTKDPKVIRWFKVMGDQVKSLHFSSALNCYDQNVFLGNMLQHWCANLETLHLSGIQCFTSLLYIFEGEPQNKRNFETRGLNCKELRSLIISVDSEDPVGFFTQCSDKSNYALLSCRRYDIATVRKGMDDFKRLIDKLPEKDPESDDPFYQLIENGTESLAKNYFEEVIIPKYFGPSNYYQQRHVDWGIIGLILRAAPLKKIIIKKLNGEQQCKDLTLFLLYQPSSLKTTLEHLEFRDKVFVGRDPFCLNVLSLFKCPLKYIRLDNFMPFRNSMGYFTDLLTTCANTLNTLEVGTAQFKVRPGRVPDIFEVPALPNLKTFVNRNISGLPLEGNRLLRNCPKLEICRFLNRGSCQGDDLKRRALDLFCNKLEECAELGHSLRELKIEGSLIFENVVNLGKGFGDLVKMDLEVDGADELECLLEWMVIKNGRMEEFTVLIGGNEDGDDRWNQMFTGHLSKIKHLKFLELDFKVEGVRLSVEAFTDGFAKMEGLTSLKINNFGVLSNKKNVIERSLDHVPFVCLSKMTNHSQSKWRDTRRNAIIFFLKR